MSDGTLSLDLLEQARALAEQAHAYDAVLRAAVYESHLLEGAGEHERAAQAARGASRARGSTGWPAAPARCSRPT